MNDSTESIATRRPSLAPWAAAEPASLPLTTRCSIALERARRWEFWPAWLYYLPIIGWILWLGIRHRSWTAFTAANPAIEAGGVVGERKHQALEPLQANAPELVARFVLIDERFAPLRLNAAFDFAEAQGYPVVLKPDVGSRGRGVYIARNGQGLRNYLERFDGEVIAQRYVDGEEYGVFVARKPGETQPRVLSIVNKTFPSITGDGKRRLRELILADARARLIANALFARWSTQLDEVPLVGERIELVEIGAHCRGSLFLDASELATPALVATLARLLDAVPGYGFGRIDLRVPSAAHLSRGEGLQVIELNGVTAESAHIYHPGTPLLTGYRAMFAQWALAFEIGQANARLGAKITGPFELLHRFREDLKRGDHWF